MSESFLDLGFRFLGVKSSRSAEFFFGAGGV